MKVLDKKKGKIKAFLLVAGRGTRLRPLTDTVPKCLLPIDGMPLLQIWLENLKRTGIDEVLINTHWLHEQVEEFVKQWSTDHAKMKIILSHEPVLLGSGGTLLANREWAGSDPFFIIYGDNLTKFDLRKMLDFHKENQLTLTIRVYQGAEAERTAIVCFDENNIITDFEEKPASPKSDLGAGGIYITDYRIFDFFPELEEGGKGGILDLSCHVLPRMIGSMQAYDRGEFSMDIGTPASYEKAKRLWSAPTPVDLWK